MVKSLYCILPRLLNLLLYILMKHISPERGQHVQVQGWPGGGGSVLLFRDTLRFADVQCSLFKVSEMLKVGLVGWFKAERDGGCVDKCYKLFS